jgi:hypothetical protein
MMISKRYLLMILLFQAYILACSQENDFGVWLDIKAKHKIMQNLDGELSGSIRTIENTSSVDQFFGEGGLKYKLNKFWSAGGSYRFISKLEDDSEFHVRHKVFIFAKASLYAGRFEFSERLMYQRTVKTYIENDNDLIPVNYARLKLETTYSGSSSPVKPFLSVEPFIPILQDKGFQFRKIRGSAGVALNLSARSRIEAGYIYEKYSKKGATDMHIISVEYNFRF